jgi:uncharacterized membrane protein
MSDSTTRILLGVFTLASCVWVGGYVAIGVVARTASRVLEPAARVAFFRALGKSYLRVGGTALVIAIGTGAALLSQHDWDAAATAAVVVAAVLVLSLAAGVVQARQMTRLRSAAVAAPGDPALADRVRAGARRATVLRAGIGLLTLALVALGSLLAS